MFCTFSARFAHFLRIHRFWFLVFVRGFRFAISLFLSVYHWFLLCFSSMAIDSALLNPLLNSLSSLVLHPLHSGCSRSFNMVEFWLLEPCSEAWALCQEQTAINWWLIIPQVEEEDRVVHATWIRENDLVLTWILNSIHADIKRTLDYFTWEKDVLDELHVVYACSDLTHVFQLEKSFLLSLRVRNPWLPITINLSLCGMSELVMDLFWSVNVVLWPIVLVNCH